jgi:hypothetical protein
VKAAEYYGIRISFNLISLAVPVTFRLRKNYVESIWPINGRSAIFDVRTVYGRLKLYYWLIFEFCRSPSNDILKSGAYL